MNKLSSARPKYKYYILKGRAEMLCNNEKRKFTGSRLFYLALTLCFTAMGLGIWSVIDTGFDYTRSDDSESADFETEIDRYNTSGRDYAIIYDEVTTNNGLKANVPVSGVPDDRSAADEESASAGGASPYSGEFAMPLGTTIIKDYSNGDMVYSKTMQDWRVHSGIDFGDNRGSSVVAIQDGSVIGVESDELWGTVVTIDHGNGLVARYCGLAPESTPETGHKVEMHEIIGTLGEIPVEKADGPHLHFEIILNGETVDPLKVMNKLGG